MTNNYGKIAAINRARKKENKEVEKPTEIKNKAKKEPELNFEPMNNKKIKLPKHPINWTDNETETHSNYIKDKLKNEHFQLVVMPPGTGKTAVAVETIGKMQEKTNSKINLIITSTSKVVSGLGWHNTIYSWNYDHPNNTIKPILIDTVDRLANALKHPKSLKKIFNKLKENDIENTVIILDEAHKYKNPTGNRAKQLQKLSTFKKIGLTATPLTNNLIMDMVSYLIMGNKYTNKTDFMKRSRLEHYVGRWGKLNIFDENGRVSRLMWPYYDIMLKEYGEILYRPNINIKNYDMPDVTDKIINLPQNIELDDDMRSLVKAYQYRMFDSYTDYFMEAMERIYGDQQRLDTLLEIILNKENKQPLIFYKNTIVKEKIEKELQLKDINYQIIDGESNFGNLDHDDLNPILIQIQSGAEGIELKNSNCSIFYQNQHSYDLYDQAKGRNRRRGMKHDINHYIIVADNEFDRRIYNVIKEREELSEEMLQEAFEKAMEIYNE